MTAILADDFTGAMDVAAPFAERGLSVRVIVSPNDFHLAAEAHCDVIVLNLDCRNESDEIAQRRVEAARAALGVRTIDFLKIDSTLRGTIRAMVETVLEPGRTTIIAPSVFEQGRHVENGYLLVEGKRLEDSDYMNDPLSPPFIGRLEEILPNRVVSAPDMVGYDDMIRLISALPQDALVVGAASAARVMAEKIAGNVRGTPSIPQGMTALAVLGSKNEVSRAQARYLAARVAGGAVITIPAEMADARRVEQKLAEDARLAVSVHQPCLLVLVGGATALAVLKALGIGAVLVTGEAMPGMPLGAAMINGKKTWIISKAGGFGDASLLARLFDKFDLRAPSSS